MNRNARRSTGARRDVYQDVTDRVVAALEAGTVPWRKPWHVNGSAHVSIAGREYRGVNQLLLSLTAMAAGYTDPRWGTFKALKAAGGSVRKGEKGTHVILWKPIVRERPVTRPRAAGFGW